MENTPGIVTEPTRIESGINDLYSDHYIFQFELKKPAVITKKTTKMLSKTKLKPLTINKNVYLLKLSCFILKS